MLPDFIIIGGMKCGTSSLFHYLNLHPQTGMSDIKEVDYFVKENNFHKGVSWYEERFTGSFKKYGEASPNYTKAHLFNGVPRRMYELLPDIKLIYLVRNPIDRIVSHYVHNMADGRERRPIIEALKNTENNHYVMCSRYYWQLNHFLKFFNEDQILVVDTDKLMKQRRKTLQGIFNFIEVDPAFYTDAFDREFHKSDKKRKRGKASRYILEHPVVKTLKQYVPDVVKSPIKKATHPVVEKPELPETLKESLKSVLHSDIQKLQDFTGQKFAGWSV